MAITITLMFVKFKEKHKSNKIVLFRIDLTKKIKGHAMFVVFVVLYCFFHLAFYSIKSN